MQRDVGTKEARENKSTGSKLPVVRHTIVRSMVGKKDVLGSCSGVELWMCDIKNAFHILMFFFLSPHSK